MKKWNIGLMLFIGLLLSNTGITQVNSFDVKMPKYVCDKGYWVMENNIKNPHNSVVYFYTNDNELMYKEQISGEKLNINRRKVLMRLNNVLVQNITAWERNKTYNENNFLVAKQK